MSYIVLGDRDHEPMARAVELLRTAYVRSTSPQLDLFTGREDPAELRARSSDAIRFTRLALAHLQALDRTWSEREAAARGRLLFGSGPRPDLDTRTNPETRPGAGSVPGI